MSEYKQARRYAIVNHGDQMYGDLPYSYHLDAVTAVVDEFLSKDPSYKKIREASPLHDTVEDTPVTFEDIRDEFGRHTARMVFAVTNEPGETREEQHLRTYPKLRAAGREALAHRDRRAPLAHL